jgi:hypothetical protein
MDQDGGLGALGSPLFQSTASNIWPIPAQFLNSTHLLTIGTRDAPVEEYNKIDIFRWNDTDDGIAAGDRSTAADPDIGWERVSLPELESTTSFTL